MATMYCALCGRPVEAKRHIGLGTIALAVVTGGMWLFAIPFYQKRCSICLSPALSHSPPDGRATGSTGSGKTRPLLARLDDVERRLEFTESELEAANRQIERLQTEQEFYRQLLDDPAVRKRKQLGD